MYRYIYIYIYIYYIYLIFDKINSFQLIYGTFFYTETIDAKHIRKTCQGFWISLPPAGRN